MEFFIPGLLLFLVSITISFIVAPRFTPLVIAILSIALLSYGVYDHHTMFAAEYRLSTWQQSLKIYAPAIMIGAIILLIIYSILAFFTKGSVPIPSLPSITAPNENSTTNTVLQSLNKNANINVINNVNNTIDKVNNIKNNNKNNELMGNNNNTNKNNNKKNNNVSRSFLETI